jgi:hypothetical protein
MAKSWLELQEELKSGASSLAVPVQDDGCGSTTSSSSSNIIDLGDPADLTAGISETLSDIQSSIDAFGSEVMGVLQDIGAWIPPELQGSGSSSEESAAQANFQAGKAFAAVDKVQSEVSQGGNIVKTEGHDSQTGDSFYQVLTSSGAGFTIDTDGSFYIRGTKNPSDDPQTGGFHVLADGGSQIKVGEYMVIEVGNNNKVLDGKGGTSGTAGPAFSLYINGNADIKCANGDLRLGGKNILIDASDSLEMKGSDIKILAGSGTGEAAKEGQAPPDEQGGSIEMKSGTFKQTYVSKQGIEAANYARVDGEQIIAMNDPQGNFAIESAGSMTIKVEGDMLEEIGGRKMTEVMRSLVPLPPPLGPAPIINGVSAGYYIVNKNLVKPALGAKSVEATPPVVYIHSPATAVGGGLKVRATSGNIDLTTNLGNIVMATNESMLASVIDTASIKADLTTPALIKGLTLPGTYVGSIKGDTTVFSATGVTMSITPTPTVPPIDKYIKIGLDKTTIKNITGIFLN